LSQEIQDRLRSTLRRRSTIVAVSPLVFPLVLGISQNAAAQSPEPGTHGSALEAATALMPDDPTGSSSENGATHRTTLGVIGAVRLRAAANRDGGTNSSEEEGKLQVHGDTLRRFPETFYSNRFVLRRFPKH
jgi:hypothetical protein